MFCLYACMYVQQVCAWCPQKSWLQIPWNWSYRRPPCECLELNPDPLQKQQIPLTAEQTIVPVPVGGSWGAGMGKWSP